MKSLIYSKVYPLIIIPQKTLWKKLTIDTRTIARISCRTDFHFRKTTQDDRKVNGERRDRERSKVEVRRLL